MKFDVGDDFPGHFCETEILNDEGIDSGFADKSELFFSGFDLVGEDQGVHGDETFDAVFVKISHELGEIGFGKIIGAETRVEFGQTEVDGIGTSGDSSAGAVPVSGR